MTWLYEIKTLITDGWGNPAVGNFSGAYQISKQEPGVPNMWIIYGPEIDNSRPRTRECLGIIYRDDISDKYLIGAPSSIGPAGDTLDDVVDNDPSDWGTYKYHCINGGNFYGNAKGFHDLNKGILTALSVTKLPLDNMPFEIPGDVHGMIPIAAPWSCGNFRFDQAASIWYGDE